RPPAPPGTRWGPRPAARTAAAPQRYRPGWRPPEADRAPAGRRPGGSFGAGRPSAPGLDAPPELPEVPSQQRRAPPRDPHLGTRSVRRSAARPAVSQPASLRRAARPARLAVLLLLALRRVPPSRWLAPARQELVPEPAQRRPAVGRQRAARSEPAPAPWPPGCVASSGRIGRRSGPGRRVRRR